MAMASHLGHLSSQIQGLLDQLAQPITAAPPLVATAAPAPTMPIVGIGSKLAPPVQFSGELGLCRTLLIDCSIHFELTPHAFCTDQSKIAFMISHLTGRAKAWASAEWARGSPLCSFLTDFQAALMRTFDPVTTDREKAQELSGLRQGSGSVCDYAICFHTLVAESGWNSTTLYDVFLKGLAYSRPPHPLGSTPRLRLPHCARHSNRQQDQSAPTATEQKIRTTERTPCS